MRLCFGCISDGESLLFVEFWCKFNVLGICINILVTFEGVISREKTIFVMMV